MHSELKGSLNIHFCLFDVILAPHLYKGRLLSLFLVSQKRKLCWYWFRVSSSGADFPLVAVARPAPVKIHKQTQAAPTQAHAACFIFSLMVTLDNDGWHVETRVLITRDTWPLERHVWCVVTVFTPGQCLSHVTRSVEPAWSLQPANQRPSWETLTNERRAQPSHNTALTALPLPSSCSTHEIILWSKIFEVEMKSCLISEHGKDETKLLTIVSQMIVDVSKLVRGMGGQTGF